jgi:catechol 2,3-dioxygenase-like lactoylglutathione lyase family enzyme
LRVRPFHHIGYVVPDLEDTVERFARTVGAGPFLAIGHVPLPGATWRGEPAVYDHSTAFGQWGETLVEISQIHEAVPAELGAFMGADDAPRVGHAAWLVDDIDAETVALGELGLELVHTGSAGPVQAHWFDGGPLFGHPIEVLRRCPEILGLYAAVREASVGWDGTEPLRPAFAATPS